MPARILLDTNILIDWFTDGPSAAFLDRLIRKDRPQLCTSVICVAEFLVGAAPAESEMMQRLVRHGDLLVKGIDGWAVAASAARIRAQTRLSLADAFIIATAAEAGCALVTRDEALARKAPPFARVIRPA